MKPSTLACSIFLLLSIAADHLKAAEYNLLSLSGKNEIASVVYDGQHAHITISCLKDTLRFKDANMLIRGPEVLLNKFLKLTYEERSGSGMEARKTLIFCVKDDHLVEAFNVMSFFKENFLDFRKAGSVKNMLVEKSLYQVNARVRIDKTGGYYMSVSGHEQQRSKLDRKDNYSNDIYTHLKFDKEKGIFFQVNKNNTRLFQYYDPKTGSDTSERLSGLFPIVQLGHYKYFFVKNNWAEE